MSAALQFEEVKKKPVAHSDDGGSPYRWTREKYEFLVESGALPAGDRVELIGGEIVSMSPQRSAHAAAISLTEEALRAGSPANCYIRVQMPISVGNDSQPDPDLAVVRGKARDFTKNHPSVAVLVIEVSDSTLAADRTIKAGLYASAGVPEYWVVNLQDNLLEVHRQPAQMADQPFGHHYKSIERLSADQTVKPLESAGNPIAVSDLLP